ncbi:DUF6344 domain-containing protein, partial [Streptomyces sp. TRM64462]|uniref:DUF6344 domain-containing protein n=1 Tax=Streptomyces sp. TRM64462 TaxID=2741726 RepID=UPI00158648EF
MTAAATVKAKQFWTACVSLLRMLLAVVGHGTPARAETSVVRVAPAVRRPAAPAPAPVPAQRTRSSSFAAVRERALPPTIKQRIRAEAHGSSPSVRRLPAADA